MSLRSNTNNRTFIQSAMSNYAFLPHIQSNSFPGALTPVGEAFAEKSVVGDDPKPAQVLIKGTGALKRPNRPKHSGTTPRIDETTEIIEENGEEA